MCQLFIVDHHPCMPLAANDVQRCKAISIQVFTGTLYFCVSLFCLFCIMSAPCSLFSFFLFLSRSHADLHRYPNITFLFVIIIITVPIRASIDISRI